MRRRLLVVLIFALAGFVIASLVATSRASRQIAVSTVKLHVEPEDQPSDLLVNTEMALVPSRSVVERVAYRLRYISADELAHRHEPGFIEAYSDQDQQPPTPNADAVDIIDNIRSRITVERVDNSAAFRVRVKSKTADGAMKLSRLVLDEYVKQRDYLAKQNLYDSIAAMETELKQKEEELQKAKEEVSRYLDENPSFSPVASTRSVSRQIADAQRRLANIDLELQRTNRSLSDLRKLAEVSRLSPEYIARVKSVAPDTLKQPVVATLLGSYESLIAERLDLASHYTELHPKMKENQGRIDKLGEQLRQEITAVLNSKVASIENQIASLQQRRASTEKEISLLQGKTARLSRLQGEYALIESRAYSLSEYCSDLRGKLADLKVQSLARPKIASVIDFPTETIRSGNKFRIISVGVIAGLLLGLVVTGVVGGRGRIQTRTTSAVTTGELPLPTILLPDLGWDELNASITPDGDESLALVKKLIPGDVIVVGGYLNGTRRTSLGINLALSYAADGKRTLLVGACPDDQRLSRLLGVDESPGLTDVFQSPSQLESAIRHGTDMIFGMLDFDYLARTSSIGYLNFLPYGEMSERVDHDQLRNLIAALRRSYDMVILECGAATTDQLIDILNVAEDCIIACHQPDVHSEGLTTFLEELGDMRPKIKSLVALT